jgi:hypothetical protein
MLIIGRTIEGPEMGDDDREDAEMIGAFRAPGIPGDDDLADLDGRLIRARVAGVNTALVPGDALAALLNEVRGGRAFIAGMLRGIALRDAEARGAADRAAHAAGDYRPAPPPRPADMTEPELRAHMRDLSRLIESRSAAGTLFALLVFDGSTIGQYISNAERASMIKAFREFADGLDAGEDVPR